MARLLRSESLKEYSTVKNCIAYFRLDYYALKNCSHDERARRRIERAVCAGRSDALDLASHRAGNFQTKLIRRMARPVFRTVFKKSTLAAASYTGSVDDAGLERATRVCVARVGPGRAGHPRNPFLVRPEQHARGCPDWFRQKHGCFATTEHEHGSDRAE